MALHTIGTKAATQLACLPGWSQVLLPADVGSIQDAIISDAGFAAILGGYSAGTTYVLGTGTTAGSTTLTAVAAAGGSPPITQIHVGDLVLGHAADIAPGTFVTAVSGTTVTLSRAAVSTGASKNVAFVRPVLNGLTPLGLLTVPMRGMLKILPGDVVAVDSAGFPYLISANSIAYAGSDWTFT